MRTIHCPDCDLKLKLNPKRVDEHGKLECPRCGYQMHVKWELGDKR